MHETSRVVVILNGALEGNGALIRMLDAADRVLAADGAGNWLAAHDRRPQLLLGDMDSIAPAVLARWEAEGVEIRRYPTHKDETDGELVLLAAAALHPEEMIVLGALGGRIDHTLGNLALLTMPEFDGILVRMFDGQSWLWLVTDRTEIRGAPGDLVSLIPWGADAQGVHTSGLAYPLKGETLHQGPSRGISNVLVGDAARVALARGRLLVVHTPLDGMENR
ncbi:MAG: thiamine diphosphokinase [Anaerolineae bacterium]|jgi:thiamine pyrophosphokinase|nr:thiamine diphosphokinase [Chloroflexota bacterium]